MLDSNWGMLILRPYVPSKWIQQPSHILVHMVTCILLCASLSVIHLGTFHDTEEAASLPLTSVSFGSTPSREKSWEDKIAMAELFLFSINQHFYLSPHNLVKSALLKNLRKFKSVWCQPSDLVSAINVSNLEVWMTQTATTDAKAEMRYGPYSSLV